MLFDGVKFNGMEKIVQLDLNKLQLEGNICTWKVPDPFLPELTCSLFHLACSKFLGIKKRDEKFKIVILNLMALGS